MLAAVVAVGRTPSLSHKIPSKGEYNKLALRSSSKLTKWQRRDDQAASGIRLYSVFESDIAALDFMTIDRTKPLFKHQDRVMNKANLTYTLMRAFVFHSTALYCLEYMESNQNINE
jgi:hypothetical protein